MKSNQSNRQDLTVEIWDSVNGKSYLAKSESECKDEIDRMAYQLLLEHSQPVKLGSVHAHFLWRR